MCIFPTAFFFLLLINVFFQLGPEDPRTKDSDLWLKELTSNAVLIAQRAREEQARASSMPIATPNTSKKASVPEIPHGELPIDQVLQYINGESGSRKGKKKNQKKK